MLMMAVENRAAVAEELISGGMSPTTPVAIIQDASIKTQRGYLQHLSWIR